jgi:hypothetical protein
VILRRGAAPAARLRGCGRDADELGEESFDLLLRATFQNSGTLLSIGVFFSLMIAGLASSLPKTLTSGLQQQGVPHGIAHQVGTLPPVSSLFAAFLGVNPVQHLLAPSGVLSSLPTAHQQILNGRQFFPDLISGPFHQGLVVVFSAAAALAVLAALASNETS